MDVALENPVLGAGPTGLPYKVSWQRAFAFEEDAVDPHNLIGFIAGGDRLPSAHRVLRGAAVVVRAPA